MRPWHVLAITSAEAADRLSGFTAGRDGVVWRCVRVEDLACLLVRRSARTALWGMLTGRPAMPEIRSRALRAAMTFLPVLPVRGGLRVSGEAEARALLTRHMDEARDALEHFGPLVEVRLKAHWHPESVLQRLCESGLIPRDVLLGRAPVGPVKLRVDAALEGQRRMLGDRVRTVLSRIALDALYHGPDGPRTLLDMSILLRRSDEAALGASLRRLGIEAGDSLTFEVSEPAPALGFAGLYLSSPEAPAPGQDEGAPDAPGPTAERTAKPRKAEAA